MPVSFLTEDQTRHYGQFSLRRSGATIHAGPNPKYFGHERGVTYYNMTSDQFTGLNGVVVAGTLRDSLVLISVVLEQETELKPVEIMTDTGAYSDSSSARKASQCSTRT